MHDSWLGNSSDRDRLLGIYQALEEHYEFDQGWPGGDWPVTGRFTPHRFEVIVGSILAQNTRWENVEMALGIMAQQGLTSAGAIARSEKEAVEAAIRSSGFFRMKADALKGVCILWASTGGIPPENVSRKDLLLIDRIGPETADSMLLYALERTEFIADAYTRRLVSRLGCFDPPFDYQSVKILFEDALPAELRLYRNFHALIVQHAKMHCLRKPLCRDCPLRISCKCGFLENR